MIVWIVIQLIKKQSIWIAIWGSLIPVASISSSADILTPISAIILGSLLAILSSVICNLLKEHSVELVLGSLIVCASALGSVFCIQILTKATSGGTISGQLFGIVVFIFGGLTVGLCLGYLFKKLKLSHISVKNSHTI